MGFPHWPGRGRAPTIPAVDHPISIAIETSCRRGGVALGAADTLVESVGFQADRRHAVQLVARLDELLKVRGLAPSDVEEVYVSVGPGSFTGLRVGVTVARTLAQTVEGLKCVAVPCVLAVAENAADLDCERLAVVLDAMFESVYAARFTRRDGQFVPDGEPAIQPADSFIAESPKPVTLIGEGLAYHDLTGDGVTLADESLWLPRADGVWKAGRKLASTSQFIDYQKLQPLYLRKPEAVRLWEQRQG